MINIKLYRLLTKTTIIYLIFIVITFIATDRFLVKKSDSYLADQSEHFFNHREHRTLKMLQHDEDEGDKEIESKINEIHGLMLISNPQDTLSKTYPIYKDTLLFDQEMLEFQLFKEKTTLLKTNKRIFEYTMDLNVDDFNKLKLGLMKNSKMAFIFLALAIVLFSFFLSGFLLTPFNRILQQMDSYKVGKKNDNSPIKTTTKEFTMMQNLFHQMVSRTEDDYRKLKEYTENMAHEIQTPLAIIRNKAEILIADDNVMEKHTSTVKAIYDESNHLSNLGNALNLLTKIENGEYNNIEEIKTHDIIERYIDSVKEIIDLKELNVELLLNPDHHLLLDPYLFEILLKNLVRNAIRYGSTDGPIRVSTTATEFTISNYGEPLNISHEKIYERFYTGNSSASSLGLGLSLVKKICDLNHLTIKYSYELNQHTFRVTRQ
ncbi:MAG: sensor histidine kinase [Bacteroidales bacterium]